MPNFGYHLARAEGAITRMAYTAALPMLPAPVADTATLPFEVYSYSGEAALPEQVASIRSLLRYAGRPTQFTVVSDGTYSTKSVDRLRALDPVVRVAQSALVGQVSNLPDPTDAKLKTRPTLPEPLQRYLTAHPTGKQLALIMSLPTHEPALYVDSDVLFFPGAHELRSLDLRPEAPPRYLADCKLSADERLFRNPAEARHPVNTGVLFITHALDWSIGLERFMELGDEPNFFTNQTITHLAMHANGAQPFDPAKFVLQLDDQFVYPDCYAGPEIVLRHYVNPVRHKFWTTLAR